MPNEDGTPTNEESLLYSNSFPRFCTDILGLELSSYHNELADLITNRYLCIIVPRGHSKSSFFSLAYPLWRLFREKNKEICLVSSSIDQSMKLFAKTQQVLETNPFFSYLLPQDRSVTWNKSQLATTTGNLFYVKPFNSTIRGSYPHYMIADDILREETTDLVQSKETFWSALYPAGQTVGCQIIVAGTPLSLEDLYADLQKKKEWITYKRSAVITDSNGKWIKPLWPERFTLEKLREIESSMSSYRFQREYMCNPVSTGDILYPAELVLNSIDYNLDFTEKSEGIASIGCDYAMSTKTSGDFNVFIVIDDLVGKTYYKKTDQGTIEIPNPLIIRQMIRYRGNQGQTEKTLRLNDQFKATRITVDKSGVGAKFVKELKEEGLWVDEQDFQPASRNALLMNLRTVLEKNRLVIPSGINSSPLTNTLIYELGGFRAVRNTQTGYETWKSNYEHDDCLKKGTLIKTDKGYKPIEEIQINDLVLTHKNRFKKVVNIIKKPFNGTFYNLKFNGYLGLEISYNHPLYAAPFRFKLIEGTTYNKRKWVLPKDWKKKYRCISIIESLCKNKLKVFNESDFYKNSRWATTIKLKSILLDNEFAEFLGRFLADGHCAKKPKKGVYPLSLAFNADDLDGIFKFSKYLINKKIKHYYVTNNKNGVSIEFNSKLLWHIMSLCYNNKREKILPYFYNMLGADLKFVLDQWLAGDGWFNPKRNEIIGATTSKTLALEMHDIAWSLGQYARLQTCKRHRYEKKSKDQYWVTIKELQCKPNNVGSGCSTHGTRKRLSSFEFGSYAKKIEKESFSGFVYNLQVDEDESFIANGIVVHNCVMALALAVKHASNPKVAMENLIFGI